MNDDSGLNMAQAAELLGLSLDEMRGRIERGRLPPPDIGETHYGSDAHRLLYTVYRPEGNPFPEGCKVIALTNQKGGVGKTSTTLNLAACLALTHRKVLVLDMDPQANCSQGLRVTAKGPERLRTIREVLLNQATLRDTIQTVAFDSKLGRIRFDLVPADLRLGSVEEDLTGYYKYEYLKEHLAGVRDGYDYVLIDTRPDLMGFHTLSSWLASDGLLAILQPERFAVQGMSDLFQKMMQFQLPMWRQGWGHELRFAGAVVNQVDERTVNHRLHLAAIRTMLPDRVFRETIPDATVIGQANARGCPVLALDPPSKASAAYQRFTQELLRRCGDGS